MNIRNPVVRDGQQGFALIEGLIAILIFSLGILGLFGLQATTTQATTLAKTRVEASFIASQRIAAAWGDIDGLADMAETDTEITALPNGTRTTVVAGNMLTVTVSWKMPNGTEHTYTTLARITGN